MKFVIKLAVLGLMLSSANASAPAAYAQVLDPPPEFRVRVDPDNQQVHVRVEIELAEPSTIQLLFRGEWEGYSGLAKRLREMRAEGPRGSLRVEAKAEDHDSGHRRVKVDDPGLVIIHYTLVLDPPSESRFFHRVSQLSADGGHLIGRDLLPRIWLNRLLPGSHGARIRIEALPRNWGVATVAGRAGGAHVVDDIGSAVFVVGRLRTRRFNIGHRSLTTAIYGDWPVSDARIDDAIQRIAGGLHRIAAAGWASGDYLLGTGRVPGLFDGISTGGQVIGKTGLVYLGGLAPGAIEFDRWLHTMAHELMHWYIPTAYAFEGSPPSWFSEGFTDYFSLKTLLAGDLIEPDAFLLEISERLVRYRSSPLYGETSLPDAEADFWEDDSYRFIYDGGAVAAFLLDLGFQARGQSLERVLTNLRAAGPVTKERLSVALSAVRENEWITAWLAGESNPDWDAELARYRLTWRGDTLVSLDEWATDVLSSIRP